MCPRALKTVGTLTCVLLLTGCGKRENHAPPAGGTGSPTGLTVFLVRHGEAYQNVAHPPDMTQEQLDSLTPKGVAQAEAAGRLLKQQGVLAVIASPTHRTRQTAEAIAAALGLTDGFVVEPALAALTAGTTPDGQPVTWSWREQEWEAGRDPRPEGGESLQDGQDRASRAVEALAGKYAGKAVVVVTHSDICAALIGKAAATPLAECYRKHRVPFASVSQIWVSDHAWTLKSEGTVPPEGMSP